MSCKMKRLITGLAVLFSSLLLLTVCSFSSRFDVNFNTNGGSQLSALVVQNQNTNLTLPEPERPGYEFEGWYFDDVTFQSPATVSELLENRTSVTLNANWNLANYRINYNLNQGSPAQQNPATFTINTGAITLSNPTREGYNFLGWFDNPNLTGDLIRSIPAGSFGDKNLYAKWELGTYTLSFVVDGSSIQNLTGKFGDSFTQPSVPTKQGFTFGGWFTDVTLSTPFTFTSIPGSNTSVFARWIPDNFAINYVLNDGLNNVNNPSIYRTSDPETILFPAIRSGFAFTGWFNNPNLTGTIISTIPKGSIGDITLYAGWTFASFGGGGGGGAAALPKVSPEITVNPEATIVYGDSVSSVALAGGVAMYNDVAVSGSFVYVNGSFKPNDVTDGEGSFEVNAVFLPNDTSLYNSVQTVANIFVNPKPIDVTVLITKPYDGSTDLPTSIITDLTSQIVLNDGVADILDVSFAGSFATANVTAVVDNVFQDQSLTQTEPPLVTPTLTGADARKYVIFTADIKGRITKGTVTIITWPTTTAINYGQTLDASSLTGGVLRIANQNYTGGTLPVFGVTQNDSYSGGSQQFTIEFIDRAIVFPQNIGEVTEDLTFNFSAAIRFIPNDSNYDSIDSQVNVTVNKPVLTVFATTETKQYDGDKDSVEIPTVYEGILTVPGATNLATTATFDFTKFGVTYSITVEQEFEQKDVMIVESAVADMDMLASIEISKDLQPIGLNNFALKIVDATDARITQKPLTITANSRTKEYGYPQDGEDLIESTYLGNHNLPVGTPGNIIRDFDTSGLITGETIPTATITLLTTDSKGDVTLTSAPVGTYSGIIEVELLETYPESTKFIKTNYAIATPVNADFEVTQRSTTISTDYTFFKTYGVTHTFDNPTDQNRYSASNLLPGHVLDKSGLTLTSTATPSTAIVGTYLVGASGGIIRDSLNNNANVTDNYLVSHNDARFNVLRRPLYVYPTINAGSTFEELSTFADGLKNSASNLGVVAAVTANDKSPSGLVNGNTIDTTNTVIARTRGNDIFDDSLFTNFADSGNYFYYLSNLQGDGIENYRVIFLNQNTGPNLSQTAFGFNVNGVTQYGVGQVNVVDSTLIKVAPMAVNQTHGSAVITQAFAYDSAGNIVPGDFSITNTSEGNTPRRIASSGTTFPDGSVQVLFTPKNRNLSSQVFDITVEKLPLYFTDIRVTNGSREIDLVFNMNVQLKSGEVLAVSDLIVVVQRKASGNTETVEVRAIVQPDGTSNFLRIRVDETEKPLLADIVEVRINPSGRLKLADVGDNLMSTVSVARTTVLSAVPMTSNVISFDSSLTVNTFNDRILGIFNNYYLSGTYTTKTTPGAFAKTYPAGFDDYVSGLNPPTPANELLRLENRGYFLLTKQLTAGKYQFTTANVANTLNPQVFILDRNYNLIAKDDDNLIVDPSDATKVQRVIVDGDNEADINNFYITDDGIYYFLIVNRNTRLTGNLYTTMQQMTGVFTITDRSNNVPIHQNNKTLNVDSAAFVNAEQLPIVLENGANALPFVLSNNYLSVTSQKYIFGTSVYMLNLEKGKDYVFSTTVDPKVATVPQFHDVQLIISGINGLVTRNINDLYDSDRYVISGDDSSISMLTPATIGGYQPSFIFSPVVTGTYFLHVVQAPTRADYNNAKHESYNRRNFDTVGTINIDVSAAPTVRPIPLMNDNGALLVYNYDTSRFNLISFDQDYDTGSGEGEGEGEGEPTAVSLDSLTTNINHNYENVDVVAINLQPGIVYRLTTTSRRPTNFTPVLTLLSKNPLLESSYGFDLAAEGLLKTPWNAWFDSNSPKIPNIYGDFYMTYGNDPRMSDHDEVSYTFVINTNDNFYNSNNTYFLMIQRGENFDGSDFVFDIDDSFKDITGYVRLTNENTNSNITSLVVDAAAVAFDLSNYSNKKEGPFTDSVYDEGFDLFKVDLSAGTRYRFLIEDNLAPQNFTVTLYRRNPLFFKDTDQLLTPFVTYNSNYNYVLNKFNLVTNQLTPNVNTAGTFYVKITNVDNSYGVSGTPKIKVVIVP